MQKLLLLVGLTLLSVAAYTQELMNPELLWQLGRVSSPEISPDGEWMIYGVTYYNLAENKGNRDLYLQKTAGGETKKVTAFLGSEWNERWRPDGKKVGFLSAEGGTVQLWEMNPDGSDMKQVSHFESDVDNFSYAPDGKHIAYTMDVKLDKTVQDIYPDLPKSDVRIIDDLMYRHWDHWHDYKYRHLYIQPYENGMVKGEAKDLMKDERHDTPLNPFGGPEQIAWSHDGKAIVYTCKKMTGKQYSVSTNSELYRYELASGKTTNLTEGMMGYDTDPAFSPDGKYMAWLSMKQDGFESDKNRLFVMDLATKKKTDMTEGWDQTAGHIIWTRDSKSILLTSPINATFQGYQLDVASKKMTQVTNGTHNVYALFEGKDNFVAQKCDMNHANELFAVNKKNGEMMPLSKVNDAMYAKVKMSKVEKRMVKTTDGKDMLVWVIYPPDFDANKKYPALLYCQGGPQSAVSQFYSFRWNFQLMAANGYIVVAPNRRGLPSFGQEWNDEISGDWGGQAMKDYLSAIDAVKTESYVDESKLGAVGASYGGYSVYWLAGNHEKRFSAFISHCGLYNLESWYATTEEMFFANWDIKGTPWDKPQNVSYQKFSPHKYVGNWDTPILVVHGERDFRVPIGEGMQAFNSAQLRGIPSRFLYFPDEGHWVLSPQNGVVWHRVYFEWLDKYLK